MNSEQKEKLAKLLGYEFKDERLLCQAITHSSWSNEHPGEVSNERLEFIGDSVLGFVVGAELFRRFPDWPEGKLTAAKSFLVGKENLLEVVASINLFDFLHLGAGERKARALYSTSIGVDAFEAIIGAIFLDGGLEEVRRVILRFLEKQIEAIGLEGVPRDSKSALQGLFLEKFGTLPTYKIERQHGPDHVKVYEYSVSTPQGLKAIGRGASKKEAQKNAAEELLRLLAGETR